MYFVFMRALFVTAGVFSAMPKVHVLCERNQTFCYGIDFWSDQKGKRERTSVIHVHFQRIFKLLRRKIRQIQAVQLLRERAIRHLRHQSVTDRVISLLQKTVVFFWNIFTTEPVYHQNTQKRCGSSCLLRQEDGRYRQAFHPESKLQTKQVKLPVLSMIWQSYMERKKIT